MLRILICIIFVAVSATGLAQENLDGVYLSTENKACRVGITGNKFYYVESLPKWTNDTLADFEWKNIEGQQFIMVYFPYTCYDYKINKNTVIRQLYDLSLPKNKIKFHFFMNETRDLDADLCVEDVDASDSKYYIEPQRYSFIYSNENSEVVVPKPVKRFYFVIEEPISNTEMHDPLGLYYGINGYLSPHYKIESDNINLIEIHMPFDYSYFEKYYTDGEFVRVHNDTLTWKGRTFVKSE